MPTIQDANTKITSFPNKFVSPFGNEAITPLYSSVPLESPVEGCLPCIVCGSSPIRDQIISNAGGLGGAGFGVNGRGGDGFGSGGGGGGGGDGEPIVTIMPTFKYIVATDWDVCLMSLNSPLSDSFIADGVTYESYPWPGDPSYGRPNNVVDGHTVWVPDYETQTATCIFATGNYVHASDNFARLNFVGVVFPLDLLPLREGCRETTGGGCCPSPAPSVPYSTFNSPGIIRCREYTFPT